MCKFLVEQYGYSSSVNLGADTSATDLDSNGSTSRAIDNSNSNNSSNKRNSEGEKAKHSASANARMLDELWALLPSGIGSERGLQSTVLVHPAKRRFLFQSQLHQSQLHQSQLHEQSKTSPSSSSLSAPKTAQNKNDFARSLTIFSVLEKIIGLICFEKRSYIFFLFPYK